MCLFSVSVSHLYVILDSNLSDFLLPVYFFLCLQFCNARLQKRASVCIVVLVLMSMFSLVKQFSGRERESLVWTYFEEQANISKRKCLSIGSKGRICRRLVAGKNASNLKSHLEVHHSEQFEKFKENEQDKKIPLNRKQDEAGNYSVVILYTTLIKVDH